MESIYKSKPNMKMESRSKTKSIAKTKIPETILVLNPKTKKLLQGYIVEDEDKYTVNGYDESFLPYVQKAFVKTMEDNYQSIDFKPWTKSINIAGPIIGQSIRFQDFLGNHRVINLFGDKHFDTPDCAGKSIASLFYEIFNRSTIPIEVFGEVTRIPVSDIKYYEKAEIYGNEERYKQTGLKGNDATGVLKFGKDMNDKKFKLTAPLIYDENQKLEFDMETLGEWNYMILSCQVQNKFSNCPNNIRFHWNDPRGDMDKNIKRKVFERLMKEIDPKSDFNPYNIIKVFYYLWSNYSEEIPIWYFPALIFQRIMVDDEILNNQKSGFDLLGPISNIFEIIFQNKYNKNNLNGQKNTISLDNKTLNSIIELFEQKTYPQKTFIKLYTDPETNKIAKQILLYCIENLLSENSFGIQEMDKIFMSDWENRGEQGLLLQELYLGFVVEFYTLSRLERKWDITKHSESFHLPFSLSSVVYMGAIHIENILKFYKKVYKAKVTFTANQKSNKCINFGDIPLEALLIPCLDPNKIKVVIPKDMSLDNRSLEKSLGGIQIQDPRMESNSFTKSNKRKIEQLQDKQFSSWKQLGDKLLNLKNTKPTKSGYQEVSLF